YSYWNPESDPTIYAPFSERDVAVGKSRNTMALRDELGLAHATDKPLVIAITRLVQQKGVDLIKQAIVTAPKKGMQFVILGAAPDPAIHFDFMNLEAQYRADSDVRILLLQEEALAHKLYAASDMILVPSLFEPCGLTQLI